MAPFETPLLKGGHNVEDQNSPANYGSTGNNQGVRTAKERNFSTGNEQSASTGNGQDARTKVPQANSTRSKLDNSMKTSQPTSPAGGKDVQIAINRNVREAYRVKLRCKCSRTGTNIIVQGALIFALLFANISQLTSALNGGYSQIKFFPLVILISLSIILLIVAGALLFYAVTLGMNNDQLHDKYDTLDSAVIVLAWLVFAFNVLIPVFVRHDYTLTWRQSPM